MQVPFDADALREQLESLPRAGRLAFALSIAERLLPNYAAFNRHHGWGDPATLRKSLDEGWRSLAGMAISETELGDLLARCEAATPDTEEFDSDTVSPALDAAVACALVLEFLLDDDSQGIVDIASLARDTVDMHVQELEKLDPQDALREQKIARHPLMQRELERQRGDLELLARADWSSGRFVDDLAARWRLPRVSNIGIA